MDKQSILEQSVRRGVQSIGNRSSLGGWLMITHKAKSIRYFGIKVVQESQVSIMWNCGLWAHDVGYKVGRALSSCTVMIARHV